MAVTAIFICFVLKEKTYNSDFARFLRRINREKRSGKSTSEAVYKLGKNIIRLNKAEMGIDPGFGTVGRAMGRGVVRRPGSIEETDPA